MIKGHRGARRVARTHQAIERALAGVKVVGVVALLVLESAHTSTPFVLTRDELAEHLQRQHARCLDGAGQRVLGDIREAVSATPPHQAPVLIATREGCAVLQWVEGEPPPPSSTAAEMARAGVLRLLLSGPRTGWDMRDALEPSIARKRTEEAIQALREEGKIVDTERRGRWVTWTLTVAGAAVARAALGAS